MLNQHKIKTGLLTGMILAGFGLLLQNCSQQKPSEKLPALSDATYVGDKTCVNCHNQEYNDWTTSHHYKAMMVANDSTVSGDFNNVTFTADGVTSKFYKKGDKFIINTQGDDGENHDYEVVYTFGFTPLQQYLVEFPKGKLQVPRVSWDDVEKKWYHQYAGSKIPPHDWIHWTKSSQNWNTMCASCHSTDLVKNYFHEPDSFHTTFSDINVSCESCHGPGSMHVELVNAGPYNNQIKQFAFPADTGSLSVINACGVCHARKADITGNMIPGHEFLDDYIPQTPTAEHFFADGQMDGEDYNYTSFLQSKMYQRGVKCTDCHHPHTGKLFLNGNNMCGKCHEPSKYDVTAHTHHPSGTTGASCVNCHMYSKKYMEIDLRHDHSFRIPRPDLTAKYGTPNTCNQCHNDRSPEWAAKQITGWFGTQRAYHFSEDLIPGSRLDEKSFRHLQKLINDTASPAIIKATAAEYLGNVITHESLEELLICLNNKDAHIRYRALRSLNNFPHESWMQFIPEKLNDPVRAVRIAAADLWLTIPAGIRNTITTPGFNTAYKDLESYILYQTDFAVGNSMAGDFYTKTQNYPLAEKYYKRSIYMDSLMNYARLNLSTVLNIQSKNEEALRVLNQAIQVDPYNDRTWYNKGLLMAELGLTDSALVAFNKAVYLETRNTRVYYNYGLLLQQKNENAAAISIYKKGLTIDPLNGDLNYALAILYFNQTKPELAAKPISVLQQYHSTNPTYFSLTRKSSR